MAEGAESRVGFLYFVIPFKILLIKIMTRSILIAWSLICIFPIYWLAVTSIKGNNDVDRAYTFLPVLNFEPDFSAWRFILADANENLVSRFMNSLIIGGTSTLLTTITACLAIYAVTRWPGSKSYLSRNVVLWIVLSTRLLPPAVLVVPFYIMAIDTGLYDTRTGLILVYTAVNLPVAVWLLLPAFGNKSTEVEEAAQLDGASQLSILFTIFLPIIRTSLFATAMLVFLLCWNEYLFAVNLTSDYALTLPPWMVGQLSMKEAQVGGGPEEVAHLSAAATLMFAPLLIFATFIISQLGKAARWHD